MNCLWFLTFLFNEFRQFCLASANGVNYWTTKISGNIVDLVPNMFFFIAFVIHIASISIYEVNVSQGNDSFVINPHFDNDQLDQFCPFYLPNLLIIAQAYFSLTNFYCESLNNFVESES